MKRYFHLLCVLSLVLALGGCRVSRQAADQKLAKACEAAVSIFLSSDEELKVNKTDFAFETPEDGPRLRAVTLEAYLIVDHGREIDRKYKCTFNEQFGAFGFGYSATYDTIDTGEKTYGYAGGKLQGDLTDHLRITDAIDRVLMQ